MVAFLSFLLVVSSKLEATGIEGSAPPEGRPLVAECPGCEDSGYETESYEVQATGPHSETEGFGSEATAH